MTVSAQYLGVHVSYVAAGAHSVLLLIACQRNLTLLVIFVDISLMFASLIQLKIINFLCANG